MSEDIPFAASIIAFMVTLSFMITLVVYFNTHQKPYSTKTTTVTETVVP